MKDQAPCDIVIPIWNQPELTQRCLASVQTTTRNPFRLILIDNGSDAPTQEALDRFKAKASCDVQIIRNPKNLGFIKAVNQGIRRATAPWICLLNNDTVVTSGWLEEMIRVASNDPKIGLVNPTSNSLGFKPTGISLDQYAGQLKAQAGQWTELTTALGFCLLSRRNLYEQVGLLEESYGMGNFDDDDLSNRVKQQGMRCVRASAAYVHHEEKASFRNLPNWEAAFERNRRQYEARWGKKLRILIAPANGPELTPFPVEGVLNLLQAGHWFTFAQDNPSLPESIRSYAQVSFLGKGNSRRWRPRATLRLLLRRKKPFDVVVSFDAAWNRWLRSLRWLYSAELLNAPKHEELLARCAALSRGSK